jgi:site-specific recombinase XerD
MIEDMTIRGFTADTQRGYIGAVRDFAAFLGRSPDQGDAEDLRRYQLHMRSAGASATSMNAAVSGLRFFFGVTLGRDDAAVGLTGVREPHRLPVLLSPEEVARLLDAATSLKYEAALSLAYGAGLRASEVVSLKISDIDREREVIRIEQGKGRKDRYAMVSVSLLALLRSWSPPANSAAPSMTPGRRLASTSPCRYIRCGTASPPTFSNSRSTFA